MSVTRFSFPTTIHFGPGARALAGPHLRDQRLVATLDRHRQGPRGAATVGRAQGGTESCGLVVVTYGGVFGNPTGSQVIAGAAAFKAHGADCVVGVGGGAALDVAKIVGLMATHPGDVMEYVWDHPQVRPIVAALPYFICPAHHLGTGSEVGRSSVISEEGHPCETGRSVADPRQGRVRRS